MWAASDHFRQSVAKLVTHSAKFWNFLDERRITAKKNYVCQISPLPPNQCWSLFPALWSFRVWSTLCRGEGGKFHLGLGCSKIRQKRSSVSLLLKPIVAISERPVWFEAIRFIEFPGQFRANDVATFGCVRGRDSDFRHIEKQIRLCLSLFVDLAGESIKISSFLWERLLSPC